MTTWSGTTAASRSVNGSSSRKPLGLVEHHRLGDLRAAARAPRAPTSPRPDRPIHRRTRQRPTSLPRQSWPPVYPSAAGHAPPDAHPYGWTRLRRTGAMRIVVLTGAGISAESGLSTFRDSDGLWEGHDPMQVATPEAYADDPGLVQRFYDARRAALSRVEPNAAHHALVRLEDAARRRPARRHPERRRPPRAGRLPTRCTTSTGGCSRPGARAAASATSGTDALADGPPCPACGVADLRPDIVWFGEIPYGMDLVEQALGSATSSSRSARRASSTRPRRSSTGRAAPPSSSTSSPAPAPPTSPSPVRVRPPASCPPGSTSCSPDSRPEDVLRP